MRACVFIVIASLFLFGNPAAVWSATYIVDHAGTGDYTTIQAAIDAAVDDDLITVLPGTYFEKLEVRARVTIRSQDGPLVTTIDAQHTGPVVNFSTVGGGWAEGTIEGFTITNGIGYYFEDHWYGAGVYCMEGARPTIKGNYIAGNAAENGGGIWCENTSSPIIDGNRITGNTASFGGGIGASLANPVIINNIIYQNRALQDGGGVAMSGAGGFVPPLHYPLISRNAIQYNEAADQGGGLYISHCSQATISSNHISNNRAHSGAGIMSIGTGSPTLGIIYVNNLIVANTAVYSAGAMWCEDHVDDLQLLSNTIADNESINSVVVKGIWLHSGSTNVVMKNSILWDNGGVGGGNVTLTNGSSLSVDHCDLMHGAASISVDGSSTFTYGANNIESNPRFASGRYGAYYLEHFPIPSPCISTGDKLATAVCFQDAPGTVCMSSLGTNPDDSLDTGTVDMGYHPARRGAYTNDFTVNPSGTGTYPTIQQAINAALAGTTIFLEDGVYTGYGNRDLDFQGKYITVRSLSLDPEACYIDCQGGPGDPHRGVSFDSAEGPQSVLQGIGIHNGYVEGAWPADSGGGIRVRSVQFAFQTRITASPTITDCALVDCAASMWGGGVYISGGLASLTTCSFSRNGAAEGGGLVLSQANASVEYCTFYANTATVLGGAIASWQSAATLYGCTIADNTAPATVGAGIHSYGNTSAPMVDHAIIAFNNNGLAVACSDGGTASLSCSDVYGNGGGDWVNCIAGQGVLNDNLNADPVFCDLPGGDLTLRDDSPCAAANNPACGQIGAYGVGCTAGPTTYAVCPDGSGDFTTIRAAILAANSGDTIELCDGTYTGPDNRDLDYLGKAITIRSQSGNPAACIINCEYSARAFYFQSGEDASSVLEGITILNGYASTAYSEADGGAILFHAASSPTITNCIFELGVADDDGGGVAIGQGSNPVFTDCQFLNNQSADNAGAVYVVGSAPTFTNCVMEGNECGNDGGAVFCIDATGPAFTECRMTGNHALDEASGIGCWNSTATMTWSLLYDNVSDGQWGGAALATQNGTFMVNHCTIVGNSGVRAGGLIADASAMLDVDNTIVAFGLVGPAADCGSGIIVLDNCDLYGNAGGDWVGCIAGQLSDPTNISEDPLFCNPGADDYTLRDDSPCAAAQMGALGVGCASLPDIEVTPPSFSFPVTEGNTLCDLLEVANNGGSDLIWSSSSTDSWLTLTPSSGTVTGLSYVEPSICADATGLDPGSYSADIIITSNDPDEPTVTVHVDLTVLPAHLGDIYLSGLPDQRYPARVGVVPGTPFHWYIVVDVDFADIGRPELNPTDGIMAWEASVNVPPEIIVMARNVSPPSSINIGSGDNFIVHTGTCLLGSMNLYTVVEYMALALVPLSNVQVTLGPSSPSSFSPPEPGWASCSSPSVPRPFAVTENLVINPSFLVKPDGTGDRPTIQAAIDDSYDGYIIYLADGTFTGVGNRDLDYGGKAITLRSSSGDPTSCIIDCENVARGVWFQQGEGSNSILRGVTIRNGEAPDMGDGQPDGGAVRCGTVTVPASPTIENCIFENCHAGDDGGAVNVDPGSAPTITDCVMDNNSAFDKGGGFHCTNTSGVTISNVVVKNNDANVGGGIALVATTSVSITSSAIHDNQGTTYGGAVYSWSSTPSFTDCLFYNNLSSGTGGGIMVVRASATLDRCTLYGNHGTDSGGISSYESASVVAQNTIIAGSPAGAAVYCTSGTVTLTCCDLYGNAGGDWVGCVAGQFGGGNISEDPLFCGPAQELFGLDDDSPCQPANNSCGVQIGALGVECHATAAPEEEIPTKVTLAQNHPNPFNPRTVIQFGLPQTGVVDLAIFDVRGRCVRRLIDAREYPAGMHEIQWNGTDDAGRAMGSGVYIYRLETAEERITSKMTLLQ